MSFCLVVCRFKCRTDSDWPSAFVTVHQSISFLINASVLVLKQTHYATRQLLLGNTISVTSAYINALLRHEWVNPGGRLPDPSGRAGKSRSSSRSRLESTQSHRRSKPPRPAVTPTRSFVSITIREVGGIMTLVLSAHTSEARVGVWSASAPVATPGGASPVQTRAQ